MLMISVSWKRVFKPLLFWNIFYMFIFSYFSLLHIRLISLKGDLHIEVNNNWQYPKDSENWSRRYILWVCFQARLEFLKFFRILHFGRKYVWLLNLLEEPWQIRRKHKLKYCLVQVEGVAQELVNEYTFE